MPLQSIPQGPFIKGVVASNQPLAQPKGAVSRGSNLLLTSRGALTPCDGSAILNWLSGVIQTSDGKILGETLFNPTGVAPYYLAIKQAHDQTLGSPRNLTAADGGTGGSLAAATYFYKVTALDGAGGETLVSNQASQAVAANHKITLTWNVVPNAFAYNIYRSTSSGTETILSGLTVPVMQPAPITATVTYSDTGLATNGAVLSVVSGAVTQTIFVGGSIRTYLAVFNISSFTGIPAIGSVLTYAPGSNATYGLAWTVTGVSGNQLSVSHTGTQVITGGTTTGGSFTIANSPPNADTTSQTALILMPSGAIPVPYTDANIVALFPASLNALNTPPSGGSGGLGTNGVGNLGNQASTPNGGIAGMVSLLPQFAQFTNRMTIALGNGFPPQAFSDNTGTPTNPALGSNIATVSVDANGVVTITTTIPHRLTQVGTNVYLGGIANGVYNTNGNGANAFVVLTIPSSTTLTVYNPNAIGAGGSTGGALHSTTIPIFSSFTPSYPPWSAATLLNTGDVIEPLTQPAQAIYLTVTQGGTTGATEPTWPTGGSTSVGQTVTDGTVIYSVAGLLNSAAPPPPGAAHITVYAGALWVFNTSPSNTANGLDGPTSLRQSSINNLNSWNPVNQAFLDKDDGTEGMGLAKFTITAQGIPPEGSLVAFKNYTPYQIIGVFGAANLQIQAVSSDLGCIAPRTILFVPGFGIMRYTHLGVAVFNGVKDEIVSEQIREYFFPSNDRNYQDITVIDANWLAISWSALSANPPMYCFAAPIGNSGGQLTRIFTYDLVMKGWDPVDLPFAISSMAQVRSTVSNPLTILGGFTDGVLQRWQAGDVQWYTGSGNASNVNWSGRSLTVASNDTDQRVYVRRAVLTGTNSGALGTITMLVNQSGVPKVSQTFLIQPNQDFDIDLAIQLTGKRFDVTFSGSIEVEVDGLTWETEPRPAGVVVAI